jgi:HK97 family phage prohead protease
MPVESCGNGRWRIGDGECIYRSEESANRAYIAYLAQEDDDEDDDDYMGRKAETYNDYPEAATNNAKRALKYKEENGSDCGTPVGWTRARQLANKERISRDTIARMASFKRHQQNKDVPYDEGCGGIMWDAWGGDAGIEWAIRKLEQIDNRKNMIYVYKNQSLEVKDVDSKQGIVSGYFSAFGMVDSDGDIMMPGAFKRSIQDWGPDAKGRIKHLLNHDPSKPLGKIMELKEDGYGLFYRSQVGKHQLGQDFVKMVESGLISEHSIGFRTLREQKNDSANEIHEVMLFEGSSLTAWGANEHTPMLGIKSIKNIDEIKEQIRNFEKFIRNSDVTDETIELCLIKVRQLAQAVEQMSSTKATHEEPKQQKGEEVNVSSLISIINKI